MAYKVYLIEPIDVDNWIELDVEGIDFTTIFSVADVSDLGIRKDNITKNIPFKSTPTNDEAFGNLFHMNRVANFNYDNRLFFNYNPLRTVDCLIYEDSLLILRGTMRVMEINVDKGGNVVYQTVVTGGGDRLQADPERKAVGRSGLHRFVPPVQCGGDGVFVGLPDPTL